MTDIINKDGGINGKKIRLIVVDTQNNQEQAISGIKFLKSQGVHFIIGPLVSNMVPVVQKFRKDKNLLFISPSIASSELSKMDDQFIRVVYTTKDQSKSLVDRILNDHIKKITVFYDIRNLGYAKNLLNEIKLHLKKITSNLILQYYPFLNKKNYDFLKSAKSIKESKTDAVLIVTNGLNASALIQQLHKVNYRGKLYAPSWVKTHDLISNGGKAIEKLIIIAPDISKKNVSIMRRFDKDFYNKFKRKPSFISHLSHDAFQVLLFGLKNSPEITPNTVKKTIINKINFKGIEADFEINQFGDTKRPYAVYQVKQGRFIKVPKQQ